MADEETVLVEILAQERDAPSHNIRVHLQEKGVEIDEHDHVPAKQARKALTGFKGVPRRK